MYNYILRKRMVSQSMAISKQFRQLCANVTLNQILDERRAEFACEWWGERFNDLVRTGRAKDVFGSKFIPGVSEFLPIPQTQIDANPNFR
ncbi:RagB/SusD family nutrient uptake outer membrane protein [Sphingobacterium sp. GVS05A]|uniref:RagB/SusD family nutrient uptake outer membrane protein n=1 Tax=Sphingobacterium TaxID=28453 RepID=UPI001CC0D5FF|nr:RagB/SusD family nutrient uptake outer membrane protein [Sphingobacterium sp. GVS05A]